MGPTLCLIDNHNNRVQNIAHYCAIIAISIKIKQAYGSQQDLFIHLF